jgi:hypothetical protein
MKTTNEMSPHFRKTVAEIDQDIAQLNGDIARLQTTRETIVELYGGETELAPPKAEKKTRKPRAVKTEAAAPERVALSAASVTTLSGFSRVPSADTVALMAVARTMPEPISATTLSVTSGKERVFCTNNINRWAARGWLQKIGYGEYKRTSSFPAQA